PTIHDGCGDSPNPVAPWFSNIFRNSGNQLSTRRNPYSLNLGKTAIRIRSGTSSHSRYARQSYGSWCKEMESEKDGSGIDNGEHGGMGTAQQCLHERRVQDHWKG